MLRNKKFKSIFAFVFVFSIIISAFSGISVNANDTYTVTANLYVPGELNKQLPGVTAYMTNGNNPLGIGGYDSVAPTSPVYDNAKLTVKNDGTIILSVPILNPVFTLQSISGCSNVSILEAKRDNEVYATTDGRASRNGRITNLELELGDKSGKYVFTDCVEFPTLLGIDWTVPLTLEVDLPDIPEPQQHSNTFSSSNDNNVSTYSEETVSEHSSETSNSGEVNYDSLNAAIQTVESAIKETAVSKDGSDVEPSKKWVTQKVMDELKSSLKTAKTALSSSSQEEVNKETSTLTAAYANFQKSEQSGKKGISDSTSKNAKLLKEGKYTISANIWFNKEDTGLPLNPHITNDTFPPMNPVADNAELTVAADGSATVVIPIVIQDKVMTVRKIDGLNLKDQKTNDSGAISEITVDLGKLEVSDTVVQMQCSADIWMGDLAMSISGLDKEHTWPATFELNLSDVMTVDGEKLPKVELVMLSNDEATAAMASRTGGKNSDDNEKAVSDGEHKINVEAIIGITAGSIIVIALILFGLYFYLIKIKKMTMFQIQCSVKRAFNKIIGRR